jgi:tetratricopeptide (TPR) repeat protein
MAIRGSLQEASLPDVLQLLSLGRKTGCLSVSHRNAFGYIYFDKGRICYASIVNRRDRLGDILVKNGLITAEQLQAGIEAQKHHRDVRLGELLVAQGSVTRQQLEEQVRVQIEESVYFLFTWTEGSFNFDADVRPEAQDVVVSVNPESLLLEGARRMDEWSLIEKKIPAFDIIFEVDRARIDSLEAKLESDQQRVLDLVDGQRDAGRIVEDSALGEFEVGKALYGLLTAGLIQRLGRSRPSGPIMNDARIEEHRNLGTAFYRTAMLEEAIREFRRLLDLRDSDFSAHLHIGLALIRLGRWDEADEALQTAASVAGGRYIAHHNRAYVMERQGRLDEARALLEEAMKRGGAREPRVYLSLASIALREGDIAAAEAAISSARPLWGARPPSAGWFHTAALIAAISGDLNRATTLLEEAIASHPRLAQLHNLLGVVHERRGDIPAAMRSLERGLGEDPSLPQLHKNLGDCLYREGSYDEALEAYRRAVSADETLGDDVYLRMGNILFRRQERDEAVKLWERALELEPGNAIVRTNLDSARQLS